MKKSISENYWVEVQIIVSGFAWENFIFKREKLIVSSKESYALNELILKLE